MSPDPLSPDPDGKPDDSAADLIHDLASEAPAKGLETVKAASDAVQGQTDDRHARIERRAYALWEESGGAHGSHEDCWHRAEAEIAAEEN